MDSTPFYSKLKYMIDNKKQLIMVVVDVHELPRPTAAASFCPVLRVAILATHVVATVLPETDRST
jgi:hypothetical protein